MIVYVLVDKKLIGLNGNERFFRKEILNGKKFSLHVRY